MDEYIDSWAVMIDGWRERVSRMRRRKGERRQGEERTHLRIIDEGLSGEIDIKALEGRREGG